MRVALRDSHKVGATGRTTARLPLLHSPLSPRWHRGTVEGKGVAQSQAAAARLVAAVTTTCSAAPDVKLWTTTHICTVRVSPSAIIAPRVPLPPRLGGAAVSAARGKVSLRQLLPHQHDQRTSFHGRRRAPCDSAPPRARTHGATTTAPAAQVGRVWQRVQECVVWRLERVEQ